MSFETLSDMAVERAKQHIIDATRDLGMVVSETSDGWNDYTDGYKRKLIKALNALIEIRENLIS